MMGGEIDQLDRRDAANLLQWWVEAGVDMPTADQPHDWLVESAPQQTDAPAPTAAPVEMPTDLAAFQRWLATSEDIPLAPTSGSRIAPIGVANAEVMILAGIPGTTDGNQPIGGDSWTLTKNMLAAIGFDIDQAYVASLLPFALPGARPSQSEMERCTEIARKHIELADPKRLILFGDGPSQLLLGGAVAKTRAKIHEVAGVRTIATFPPKFLLNQPLHKARVWQDLQLLMDDSE